MIKKLEIQKKEDVVVVHVKLEKKINKKTPIIIFSWKEAEAKVKEKYPETKIGKPLEYKSVLRNHKGENLEESWVFPIIKKQVKQAKAEKKVEPVQKTLLSSAKKRNKNRLTEPRKSATVEETEQSDEPVIVQEPTE